MRAAIYRTTGPAHEVLELTELHDPEPTAGEVRVRVHVSGVNPSDWRFRSGSSGVPVAFDYQIPGQDGAGVIDAVGEGVDPNRVGERVWVYHAAFGRPGGTAAEYVLLPAAQAVALPAGIPFEQAAGLGIPFMTAHRALFADGPIDGRTVLIAGGAGAVGYAAIQLAKRAGARVVTTVSTEQKAALAKSAGADLVVVGYRRKEAAAEIRAFAPAGVDRVVEVAFGANAELNLAVLAVGGVIACYATEPTAPTLDLQRLMILGAQLRFLLIYTTPSSAHEAAIAEITAALVTGDLRPLPTRHYALEDIADAHVAVENGVVGKVVIDVSA